VFDINMVEPLVQCDEALASNMYNISTEPAPELSIPVKTVLAVRGLYLLIVVDLMLFLQVLRVGFLSVEHARTWYAVLRGVG
jgi:hypothetical protein